MGTTSCCQKSPSSAKGACSLRIIAVNDVYLLDNLPRLKTLVSAEASGRPPGNVVTTLAGDFLAPSLLSSLDAGRGMVRVLNQIPIDYVCFGNHEQDVPYPKLIQRISEFQGTWLNSNMPDFKPKLAMSHTRSLVGKDGTPDVRKVAFTGFCIGGGRFHSIYRDGALGGAAATMVPVLQAAPDLYQELRRKEPDLDEVVPLTHQDMAEDKELANMNLFPVIVAGHDHEVINEVHGTRNSPVVKAGQDAANAAIIDLVWGAVPSDPPQVNVTMKTLADYQPDSELVELVDRINRPVRELESAMLYEIHSSESLSSVDVKFQDSTMARKVASAIRDCLDCDAAVINSGAIRGNKTYQRTISYGDLKKECPYPSPMIVVPMPFSVLRDAVRASRRSWWDVPEGGTPKESTSALQVDSGMCLGPDHAPMTIGGEEPVEGTLYSVGCDTRVLQKNEVFKAYCKAYPDRIPPEDAGRPVLPILVEFFCGRMWQQLLESAAGSGPIRATSGADRVVELFDTDHDGCISAPELTVAVQKHLGENLSSRIIVEQMITMMDEDGSGTVNAAELRKGLRRIMYGQ